MTCLNCNDTITKKFCGNCGQQAAVKRIDLLELIKSLPYALIHVDKGILFNMKKFFSLPGYSAMDYIAGKRKNYFNPVTYLALALLLNYIVLQITDMRFYDLDELTGLNEKEATLIIKYDSTQRWFLENSYLYMLIAIPLTSLIIYVYLKLLKLHYNLAETAVIILFVVAQGTFYQSILYFIFGWINSGLFIRTIESINAIILIGYSSLAFFQIFNRHGIRKKIVLAAIGGTLLLLLMLISTFIVSWMFNTEA